jgi:hypothetical protein
VDIAQVFIFVAGWVFFAAWGMVLAAISVIAFGKDILSEAHPTNVEKKRL